MRPTRYEQVRFIAIDSVQNALAWEDRIMAAIDGIGEHPGYARDEEQSRRAKMEVRRMVFEKNYLVLFTVDHNEAVVDLLEFRHAARRR